MSSKAQQMKDLIIENLKIVSKDEPGFKKKFYNQAIKALQDMEPDDIMNRNKFDDINGIGKKINEKIIEIKNTGNNLQKVDTIIEEKKTTFDLTTIYGIGLQLKKKIHKEYGKIKDLKQLQDLDAKHGFLNEKHKIGIKYYDDLQLRIPRWEMDGHNDFINDVINLNKFKITYDITGSYRRQNKDSGDIDILVTSDGPDYVEKYKEFVTCLKCIGYISDDLAFGDNKFMGVCKLPGCNKFRRLDIIVTTPEQYHFEVLYFTGSDDFNKEMRSEALKQGYSLSQYNFTDVETGTIIDKKFNSEEDIFKFLGFKYVEPKDRKSGALVKA